MQKRNFNLSGQAITDGLRKFNAWRDDFLIELSTLMLMIGFVAGTVDVFTSAGLSRMPVFNYGWAIVQAIAIDGLFFAVWSKIRRATWSWATAFGNIMLIVVGLLLALVASLVNGLLSYQEINHVASIHQAMRSLGIDQTTFTYARAILVVLVSILVALFCREAKATEEEVAPTATQAIATPVQVVPVAPVALPSQPATAIAELATSIAHSPEPVQATQDSPVARSSKDKRSSQGATEERATENPEIDHIVIIGSEVRDRIKEAMIALPLDAGYQAIADHAQCGYSTVKKYAKSIREELSA